MKHKYSKEKNLRVHIRSVVLTLKTVHLKITEMTSKMGYTVQRCKHCRRFKKVLC